MTPHTKEFDALAESIADTLGEDLGAQYQYTYTDSSPSFDYAYGDTPVIGVYMADWLDCNVITETQFDAIEAAIETLPGAMHPGFTLSAHLSDISGYHYWAKQDEPIDIILVAAITDIDAINRNELCDAFVTLAEQMHTILTGDTQ